MTFFLRLTRLDRRLNENSFEKRTVGVPCRRRPRVRCKVVCVAQWNVGYAVARKLVAAAITALPGLQLLHVPHAAHSQIYVDVVDTYSLYPTQGLEARRMATRGAAYAFQTRRPNMRTLFSGILLRLATKSRWPS